MERREYQPPAVESQKISPEIKGRGVFYDTHDVMKENGELGEYVIKDFHLDLLFSPESAVELFSKQEEEHELFSQYFPEEMVPQSAFLVPPEFLQNYEDAKLDIRKVYSYPTFIQIQLNRRLQGRYGLDERVKNQETSFVNRAMRSLGKYLEKKTEKPVTGTLIQERIHGISFGELMKNPEWKNQPQFSELQKNVDRLILGLRTLHSEQPLAVFTWHSLESDNVMVETDEKGDVTGRVVVVDTNFLLKPDLTYKRAVVSKLEKSVLDPLEKAFDLV